jgi:hypothetical protein
MHSTVRAMSGSTSSRPLPYCSTQEAAQAVCGLSPCGHVPALSMGCTTMLAVLCQGEAKQSIVN